MALLLCICIHACQFNSPFVFLQLSSSTELIRYVVVTDQLFQLFEGGMGIMFYSLSRERIEMNHLCFNTELSYTCLTEILHASPSTCAEIPILSHVFNFFDFLFTTIFVCYIKIHSFQRETLISDPRFVWKHTMKSMEADS